jgi:hypothetical protein
VKPTHFKAPRTLTDAFGPYASSIDLKPEPRSRLRFVLVIDVIALAVIAL